MKHYSLQYGRLQAAGCCIHTESLSLFRFLVLRCLPVGLHLFLISVDNFFHKLFAGESG